MCVNFYLFSPVNMLKNNKINSFTLRNLSMTCQQVPSFFKGILNIYFQLFKNVYTIQIMDNSMYFFIKKQLESGLTLLVYQKNIHITCSPTNKQSFQAPFFSQINFEFFLKCVLIRFFKVYVVRSTCFCFLYIVICILFRFYF